MTVRLTSSQAAVLVALVEADRAGEPTPTQGDLANRVGIRPRAAQDQIRALREKGLVIRHSKKWGDYELTKEGRTTGERLLA